MAGRSKRKLTVPPAMHSLPLICPDPFPSDHYHTFQWEKNKSKAECPAIKAH